MIYNGLAGRLMHRFGIYLLRAATAAFATGREDLADQVQAADPTHWKPLIPVCWKRRCRQATEVIPCSRCAGPARACRSQARLAMQSRTVSHTIVGAPLSGSRSSARPPRLTEGNSGAIAHHGVAAAFSPSSEVPAAFTRLKA